MIKYINILYLITLILIFRGNLSFAQDHSSSEESKSSFKVIQIDSIPEAFIVYIKKDTSLYKIVSIKKSVPDLCKKISIGSAYHFKLKSWLNTPNKIEGHIRGLHIGGKAIGYTDEKIVQDLFYTQNLVGLCYNYSNTDTINMESLESVLKMSLINFRANIKEPNAFVFFNISNKLQTNEIGLSDNVFLLPNNIDPKILNKKENNYLIGVLLEVNNGEIVVKTTISRVIKKKRKEVSFQDLSYTYYYKIIPSKN